MGWYDPLAPITAALAAGAKRLQIPDGAAIVLAVSGGPDSTALLHGAAALAPDPRLATHRRPPRSRAAPELGR